MAIAVFDYAAWTTRYPEMGAVNSGLAASYFTEAGLYLDNTDCSPVTDVAMRLLLLNMLTAHIAQLNGALEPDGKPSGLVGRVTSATEGSVSVGVGGGPEEGSAEWYAQTQYGYSFWQATKRWRSATYVPGPRRNFEPWRYPWQR